MLLWQSDVPFQYQCHQQYGRLQGKYCKRTTMGMCDYVLKDVILIPTDKASVSFTGWEVAEKVLKQEPHLSKF